jgi:hypothetical protein
MLPEALEQVVTTSLLRVTAFGFRRGLLDVSERSADALDHIPPHDGVACGSDASTEAEGRRLAQDEDALLCAVLGDEPGPKDSVDLVDLRHRNAVDEQATPVLAGAFRRFTDEGRPTVSHEDR